MRERRGQEGFTLVEAFIALAIGVIFLASVTSTWFTATKVWKEENVRSELRLGIEKAMERVKNDVRLSDGNGILFYPAGAATYEAVSLPASVPNAGGYLTFSGGLIQWNRTVIYHVYNVGGRSQLRRTVIPSFNTSTVVRQAQLDTVAVNGTTGGASTVTMFSTGNATLEIVPQVATFEGYSSALGRSDTINFGSLQLASGSHTVTFQVTGKNAASSGYEMGIDSISLTPSGHVQEAEALTISSQVGASATTEDMSGFGVQWGGGEHVSFPAVAAGASLTFTTEYDRLLESNFASSTHSNTEVTTGADPVVRVASRETQSLTPAWTSSAQTVAGDVSDESAATPMAVRVPVQAGYITRSGVMMRVKLTAGSAGGGLTIANAYFGPAVAPGSPSMSMLIPLYFDGGTTPEGDEDGVGPTTYPGIVTSVFIPAGSHAWSNWFIYPISAGGGTEYLVSLSVPGNGGETATSWAPNPLAGTFSYRTNTPADAAAADWSGAILPTSSSYAFAVAEIATWQNVGTMTSQIYDTKIVSPNFDELSWDSSLLPAGSTLTFKVRSSNDSTMLGATDWSLLGTYATSPANLGAVADQRYVQFQATLTAASPYTSYPWLDDVKIDWPGTTGLVEITGSYTTRPDYGQFKVLVDGSELVKALELKVTASDTFRGQTYTYSLNTEQDPLNTGR